MTSTSTFQLPDLQQLGIQCAGVLADSSVDLTIPGVPLISPALADPPELKDADIQKALEFPIGSKSLFEIVRPGESLCIVVSDHTRHTASDRVLPALINGLLEHGCAVEDMFIMIASGIHRHPSTTEIERILGTATADRFRERIFLHDPDNSAELALVGTTSRGHRVLVNRQALAGDRLILTGTVIYHYHAGFGGGRKALVPGLASRDTIAFSHSLTIDPVDDRIHPGVGPGLLDGNPVSEEMLEGARLCEPDAIINTILTPGGRIARVCAGELDAAHRAACGVARDIYSYSVPAPADLVIADAGSASNWIQSHKALFNAARAVHSDGRIVLVAPCPEGLGNERFRHWIRKKTVSEIFDGLRTAPEALGQTALSTKERGRKTILVTGMPEHDIEDLGIRTAPDLESAITAAVDDLRSAGIKEPTCYIMPQARYTVPFTD